MHPAAVVRPSGILGAPRGAREQSTMNYHRSVNTLLSALLGAFIALAPVARAQNDQAATSGAQPEPALKRQEAGKTAMSRYSRVVEDDEGQTLKLEMAVYSYVPRD